MALQKFKKFYTLMSDQNQELFEKFDVVHAQFVLDPQKNQAPFHALGLEVVDTVRFWERKLCAGMERGNNAVYSDKLADKFWNEVRTRFPQIDMVGVQQK